MVTEQEAARLLNTMAMAINNKDLPTLVSCFHSDYESIQPVHPERSFRGQQRLGENWNWVFQRFDAFNARIIDFSVRENTIWSEWIWHGTDDTEDDIVVRGVMILTVDSGCFRAGRLYMEPVRS